jgi:hypothetical protein
MERGNYLVGEDDDIILDAEVADLFKFLLGEDFADGIVSGYMVSAARGT